MFTLWGMGKCITEELIGTVAEQRYQYPVTEGHQLIC